MTERVSGRRIIRDGPHIKEVLSVLGQKMPTSSLASITERAAEILEKSVDPIAGPPEHPSDGLLYGLIQSGKTSIIQVAAAMAADNGFQCILILTSDIDLLYDQTLERVRLALQGLNVLGKNDWRDPERFERQLRNPPFVIVCSKNGSKLGSLLEAFQAARARGISALIIDDEADQASLNTFASKKNDRVSPINQVISDLRAFFNVNTYVQVTATPQALFLQTPEHRYRPSFTVMSDPGPGYVGGQAFFGDPHPLLRFVDVHEIDHLRTSHQPSPIGTIPNGLRTAILTFLVAATARKIANPSKRYAFLCHVSVNKKDHEHIVTLIERFKEKALNILQGPDGRQREHLVRDLRTVYEDLGLTQSGLPVFEEIIDKVKFYLHGANVKLINATSSEEIKLDAVYNIFVGGNKLGRGVTIENLLVSYYGRNPKRPNADTVLQHARMYGYRQDDLGVTRLFLPEKLSDHFCIIHDMESALRDLVQNHPEGNFEILCISKPLQATRRNVLDPESLEAYVAGESINPRYPLRTKEVDHHTSWLDEKLKDIGDQENGRQITTDQIMELIDHCPIDPKTGGALWNLKMIRAALDTIKTLMGDRAHVVVRRGRSLKTVRRERQGILSGGEEDLAPKDSPTLFLYRQEPNGKENAVWWPQLRFPQGNRNYVLSFSVDRDGL